MSGSSRLEGLRGEIEPVTLAIIDLVGQRNALAHSVALEKSQHEVALVNTGVERHLRELVIGRCDTVGVEPSFGIRLLNQLIDESIRIQMRTVRPEPTYDGHKIFSIAKELEQVGQKVIHLEVGEPDFGPPESVIRATTDALSRRFTNYAQSAGIPALRQKITKTLSEQHQREVTPREVLVTASGKYALFLAITCNLELGDEAIIIDPSYPSFSSAVRRVGARPIHIPSELENNWNPDVEMIQEQINRSTRLIIVNSPCTPTGKVLDEETCRALMRMADDDALWILSDEVYSSFAYTPYTSFLQFLECRQVTIKSFSKPYGMTGFRLGYAVADPTMIEKMADIQYGHLTSIPEFVQYAGLAALDCEDEVVRNASTIKSNLQLVSTLQEDLPVSFKQADGGFYLFVRLEGKERDGVRFAEQLLTETGVCVTPDIVYGPRYSSFFRIAVCQPENQLREGLARIGEFLR
jgi:aspartate aminotransferase